MKWREGILVTVDTALPDMTTLGPWVPRTVCACGWHCADLDTQFAACSDGLAGWACAAFKAAPENFDAGLLVGLVAVWEYWVIVGSVLAV